MNKVTIHPTISVIIPVYNTEKYLRRCLDSIVAQTYKDFECILVDDGSTDSSSVICNEYSKKYSRFKTYHLQNGGPSRARNYGLEYSRGGIFYSLIRMIGLSRMHLKYMPRL